MDEITLCAATVAFNESGHLVVTACNNQFFRLMGQVAADMQIFPFPFDALITSAATRELREKLLACFASDPPPQEPEQIHHFSEGRHRWRLSFKPIRRATGIGRVSKILVTGFDITTRAHAVQDSGSSASRYRALVDLAYDAIVTMDERHNITLFNRAAENLFGFSAAEVLGRPIVTLLPEKFRADHASKVQQFADSYQAGLRQMTAPRMDDSNSVYGQHRDGSVIPVEIAVSRIEMDGGTEFMAVVRDVTDRARLMELLKKQAGTDALTDLPNRREFLQFVKKALAGGDVLSVFILDIDFFKDINDQHGHDAGDEVLRALAKVGSSVTDGRGLFARWGGEEFVAALPGADADVAHSIADDLRKRYERQDFEHVRVFKPIPFTVSIGVVTRETADVDLDVDALMKRADRALYRAKKSGRNRVERG